MNSFYNEINVSKIWIKIRVKTTFDITIEVVSVAVKNRDKYYLKGY